MLNKTFLILCFILPLGLCTKIIYREIDREINIDTTIYKIIRVDTIKESNNNKFLQITVKNKR